MFKKWRKKKAKRLPKDQQIAKVLSEVCPMFYQSEKYTGAGALWHVCYCKGQPLNTLHSHFSVPYQNCRCVWHKSDTCLAGTWDQLAFINSIPTPVLPVPPTPPNMQDAMAACQGVPVSEVAQPTHTFNPITGHIVAIAQGTEEPEEIEEIEEPEVAVEQEIGNTITDCLDIT